MIDIKTGRIRIQYDEDHGVLYVGLGSGDKDDLVLSSVSHRHPPAEIVFDHGRRGQLVGIEVILPGGHSSRR